MQAMARILTGGGSPSPPPAGAPAAVSARHSNGDAASTASHSSGGKGLLSRFHSKSPTHAPQDAAEASETAGSGGVAKFFGFPSFSVGGHHHAHHGHPEQQPHPQQQHSLQPTSGSPSDFSVMSATSSEHEVFQPPVFQGAAKEAEATRRALLLGSKPRRRSSQSDPARRTATKRHGDDTTSDEDEQPAHWQETSPRRRIATSTATTATAATVFTSELPLPLPSVQQVRRDAELYVGPTRESNWVFLGRLMVGAYPSSVDDEENHMILTSILRCGITTFVCLQMEYQHDVPDEAWRSGQALRPYIRDAMDICEQEHMHNHSNWEDEAMLAGPGSKSIAETTASFYRHPQPHQYSPSLSSSVTTKSSASSSQLPTQLLPQHPEADEFPSMLSRPSSDAGFKETTPPPPPSNPFICRPIVPPAELKFLHTGIVDCGVTTDSTVLELSLDLCGRLMAGENLYVHCWGGHGRTGTVVAVVLGLLYGVSSAEALARTQLYHDLRVCSLNVPSPQTMQQRRQVERILEDVKRGVYAGVSAGPMLLPRGGGAASPDVASPPFVPSPRFVKPIAGRRSDLSSVGAYYAGGSMSSSDPASPSAAGTMKPVSNNNNGTYSGVFWG